MSCRLSSITFLVSNTILIAGCSVNTSTSDGVPPLDGGSPSRDERPDDGSAAPKESSSPMQRVIRESSGDAIDDVMLTVADPREAAAHFRDALSDDPGNIEHRRHYAMSLDRAGERAGAGDAWDDVVSHGEATEQDHLDHAMAMIRLERWDNAEASISNVSAQNDTVQRHRVLAILADNRGSWDDADRHHEQAVALSEDPARALNNWGYSHLLRDDHADAEQLFMRAIESDDGLFEAKNNLAMARGAQGNYQVPSLSLGQDERARIMHTIALAAIRNGDHETARSLLRNALQVHPRHFEDADRLLDQLDQMDADSDGDDGIPLDDLAAS